MHGGAEGILIGRSGRFFDSAEAHNHRQRVRRTSSRRFLLSSLDSSSKLISSASISSDHPLRCPHRLLLSPTRSSLPTGFPSLVRPALTLPSFSLSLLADNSSLSRRSTTINTTLYSPLFSTNPPSSPCGLFSLLLLVLLLPSPN